MNDEDYTVSPFVPRQKPATIPMRVFLRRGSALCIFMLIVLHLGCWKVTGGTFPVGIKLYALNGLICFFIVVRYLSGRPHNMDFVEFKNAVSPLQALIVVILGVSSGAFLTWFFHG